MAYTRRDIEAASADPRWGGFGYIGERQHLDLATRRRADAAVIRVANRERWSRARFFDFLNSRAGRHFADRATFAAPPRVLEAQLSGSYLPWARNEGASRRRARGHTTRVHRHVH